MNQKLFFSIAIPFYFRNENSLRQLIRGIKSIEEQSFKNYEVVISAQNEFNKLKKNKSLQRKFIKIIDANHVDGFIQGNINNSFKFCKGLWIKLLFSDDYFFNKDDLKNIYNFIKKEKSNWYIMNSIHCIGSSSKVFRPILPFYQSNILELNTIGSPSAIAFKNSNLNLFDQNTWMRLDVDYYYSLFLKYGEPNYISNVFIVNEIHKDQFSSLMINKTKLVKIKLHKELDYLCKKYKYKKLNPLKKFLLKLLIRMERLILNILFKLFKRKSIIFVSLLFRNLYLSFY